jgi:hypothetical protein
MPPFQDEHSGGKGAPHEFPALLTLGIRFTDLCKLGSGIDHRALAFPVDIPGFRKKMRRYRPETIAFSGKKPRAFSMAGRRKRWRSTGSGHRMIFQGSSCWPRPPAPGRTGPFNPSCKPRTPVA